MEFVIEKCAMLIMKSEKQQMTEETELPNQEKIRKFGSQQIFGLVGWFYCFMAYQPSWFI